jgi:hypothetical protein
MAQLLEDSQKVAASLDQFRDRVEDILASLQAADSRTVEPAELNDFRGSIVRMARDARCQIRRIDVSGASVRPWNEGDPLQTGAGLAAAAEKGAPAPRFDLTAQTLALQVTGKLEDVKSLVGALEERGILMRTKSFALRPYGTQRDEVILDLELVLYSLTEAKTRTA